MLDLPSSLGHPVLETTLGYLRSIYDIQLRTAEELAALTETQRDAFNKNLFSALGTALPRAALPVLTSLFPRSSRLSPPPTRP
ncbi:MAG: hypothetical protein IPG34_10485 [Rhodocyclaceae bacterium]|nr:hypothetical protein [Rhodocyclaceae bacterium]